MRKPRELPHPLPLHPSKFTLPAHMESFEMFCQKRGCLYGFIVLLVFMLSFTWYNLETPPWHPTLQSPCKMENPNKATLLHNLKEVKLQRMLYEKPNAVKPPRTDVLMMTPWFAPIVWNSTYDINILNAQFHQKGVRIGITVFAVKKYVVFVKLFIETAEKFFMVGHKVNYYIFTDREEEVRQQNFTLNEGRQLIVLAVPAYKRWQEVSMRRMEMINNQTYERFADEIDYLVCVDVDMRFSDDVGVEILSDLFGTLHPGYYGAPRTRYTYERRSVSAAFIPEDEGDFYYAGGFFGGSVAEVFKLTNFCHNAMLSDTAKNIEALWHDESYLNNYFLYHKPTKILSPEYLWDIDFAPPGVVKTKRFSTVPKNKQEIRN